MDKDKAKKIIRGTAIALGATYVVLDVIAKKQKGDSTYKNDPDQQNPMQGKSVQFVTDENDKENADGKSGHLEATGESNALTRHKSAYEKYGKRAMDKALSFGGLVVLAPVMGTIALAIKIEDPGPVLFTQKRVGQDKQYFKLHKFRSMKMSTPHDVPTHMLENPEQYITKVGGFIRKHSLDELPQIWDIFVGNMSVIGPRPALWNQDVLVAERDKVGANDVKPGLTGWAQINGRDELSIADKSMLDGVYTKSLKAGGTEALKMDSKCFAGSIHVFNGDDSVVEGGTGAMVGSTKGKLREGVPEQDPEEHFACDYKFTVNHNTHKNILIVGSGSYIGESFVKYATEHYCDNFTFTTVDTLPGEDGKSELDSLTRDQLANFDIVYHLAGKAHADVGHVDDATKEKYYKVNTDLAVDTARRYKAALEESGKTGLFVFMSSMIVYGDSAPYGQEKIIDRHTVPSPANFYGDSKWQADKGIRALSDETMHVAIIRPPMIYGKGSKGNYPTLAKLAKKLPIFPDVNNCRSMLYIGNLCELLSQLFLATPSSENNVDLGGDESSLILMPQNGEYTKTSVMVKNIAETVGNRISVVKVLNPAVLLAEKIPGKISAMVDKAFGNNSYDLELSRYNGLAYQKYTLERSIELTEGAESMLNSSNKDRPGLGKKVLIVASVASMIDQFNKPNIELLESLGYDVDVATNFNDPGTITLERCTELMQWLADHNVDCYQINFDRNVANVKADKAAFDEMDRVFKGTAEPISTVKLYPDGHVSSVKTEKRHTESTYAFMHCHSPIGGVVGRITAHKNHVKSIYTAHGFHFYDGAPKKNWILFYPVEKELSRITDVLITINNEDYNRAKNHFFAKKTVKIPGVGVDTAKFETCHVDKNCKRKELGIPQDAFLLLSVSELSDRKNQRVIIEAMKKLKETSPVDYEHIYYLAVGQGELKDEYKNLIQSYGLTEHVKLLGFRPDIGELCETVDCFVHLSVREGLGIAPLEAMAAGLPLIFSYVNGIKDYTEDGKSGVCITDPMSADAIAFAVEKMYKSPDFRESCGVWNYDEAKKFDIKRTDEIMAEIYGGGYAHLAVLFKRWEIRDELGIPKDAFVIMSAGELNDNKNHAVIIKAIVQLKDPDIHYVIAGRGVKEEKLKELSTGLGIEEKVHILGYRSNIADLLHASDCFAFPSKREGLGLAAIEAMASRLPLLTSNSGGINDYSVNGVTGYKYAADDVEGFADGIEKLKVYSAIRFRMSKGNGIESKNFDQSKTIEIMNDVYKGML